MSLTTITLIFIAVQVLCAATVGVVFVRVLIPSCKAALSAIEGLTRSLNTSAFVNTELARITQSSEVALTAVPGLLEECGDSLEYLATAQRHELQRAGRKHQF